MQKNTSGQYVAFQAISTTDGSNVTTGSPTVYYTIDGGTQATASSSAVHEGNGCWSISLSQAETNGDHIVYTFVLSGAISQSVNVYPVDFANYKADVSALATASSIAALNNFDPATDTVANVTTVATCTTNSDMRGTDGANTVAPDNAGIAANGVAITSLNDFDPAADTVASVTNVTLVGTCTTNSDMRGTDGANTVAPDNAGIAANGVSIAALNDFDPAADTVANVTTVGSVTSSVTTDAASRTASQADVSGLATAASITALNDFDPAADTVANVTTVATCTTNSDMRGTDGANTVAPDNAGITANGVSIAALNDFDPATDTVANVTLVGTCTTNSDMRGTDNALLAASAPSNWSTLIIGTGVDAGKVTTSNPASGGGSNHTAQDVANLILVTPANKLATDSSGDVSANNMRGTDGANTVAPDNAGIAANGVAITSLNDFDPATDTVANVTIVDSVNNAVATDTASRDASKADVSGLATAASITALNDFDPATDTVANVTLVGTCTTNSDMRGTDGANTVAPDNTGITANGVAIAALNDFDPAVDVVTVGTNNDKTGYALSSAANDAIGAAFLAYTLTKGGAGTIERAFWQSLKVQNVTDGEVSGTPTTEAFNTNLTATTGAFDHLLILFTTGALAGEARPIETYSSTDGRIVLQEALTAAPSAADEFIIVPSHVHPVSEIVGGVWTDPAAALLTKTGVTYTATAQSGDTIQVTLS